MSASKPGIPSFFLALSTSRRLLALAAVALISGAAMLPAMRTMSGHGYSLLLILSGHVASPWPQISAVGGSLTTILMAAALLFAVVGVVATRDKSGSGLVGGGAQT